LPLADNGNSGYAVHPAKKLVGTDEVMPIFVRQAFESFELLVMPPETEQQSNQPPQQNNALQLPVLFLSINTG
jgi:hypothetical protein